MFQGAIYDRQNRIKDLKIPNVASVVGCGGTGFWTAVFLAMSGVEELILVDPDTLETSNLNRLPLKEDSVGVKKTIVTGDFINSIRKPIRIEVHNKSIKKAKDCGILRGTVFCCTDNLKSQQIICAYCKKNDIPYQRIGYDGTVLNVSKAFPLSFEESANQDGYTVTPSWVIPAVLAASIGVSSKLYKELCIMDDIGKIHIQNCSYVPEKILDDAKEEERDEIMDNIHDYIPDSYGCCEDCDRVNPDDGYGYCGDCQDKYSEEEIEEIKEGAREEGFRRAIEQIESGGIEDKDLRSALKSWKERKEAVNV
ncbi:MAG: ThiF family adenylyltransferase [Candidatus Woesearchaeota archaeon]